jgi:hypothetical protein
MHWDHTLFMARNLCSQITMICGSKRQQLQQRPILEPHVLVGTSATLVAAAMGMSAQRVLLCAEVQAAVLVAAAVGLEAREEVALGAMQWAIFEEVAPLALVAAVMVPFRVQALLWRA